MIGKRIGYFRHKEFLNILENYIKSLFLDAEEKEK